MQGDTDRLRHAVFRRTHVVIYALEEVGPRGSVEHLSWATYCALKVEKAIAVGPGQLSGPVDAVSSSGRDDQGAIAKRQR